MTPETEKQLNRVLNKQEDLLDHAKSINEVSVICSTWCGFLAGLKLAGTITQEEYNQLFAKLEKKVRKIKKFA